MRSLSDLINNDVLAAKGAGFIDLLLIVGIVCAILFVDKVGSIRLQIMSFIGCAAGLAIAASSTYVTGGNEIFLIFAGFMVWRSRPAPTAHTQSFGASSTQTPIRIAAVTNIAYAPAYSFDITGGIRVAGSRSHRRVIHEECHAPISC